MGAKKTRELPARLEGVRGRFERWRRGRKGGARIPETLWDAAVKMAGAYGVNRTAKALRVNYYALKKRVERQAVAADGVNAAAIAQSTSADVGAATFLELAPFEPAASDFIDEVRTGFGGRRAG